MVRLFLVRDSCNIRKLHVHRPRRTEADVSRVVAAITCARARPLGAASPILARARPRAPRTLRAQAPPLRSAHRPSLAHRYRTGCRRKPPARSSSARTSHRIGRLFLLAHFPIPHTARARLSTERHGRRCFCACERSGAYSTRHTQHPISPLSLSAARLCRFSASAAYDGLQTRIVYSSQSSSPVPLSLIVAAMAVHSPCRCIPVRNIPSTHPRNHCASTHHVSASRPLRVVMVSTRLSRKPPPCRSHAIFSFHLIHTSRGPAPPLLHAWRACRPRQRVAATPRDCAAPSRSTMRQYSAACLRRTRAHPPWHPLLAAALPECSPLLLHAPRTKGSACFFLMPTAPTCFCGLGAHWRPQWAHGRISDPSRPAAPCRPCRRLPYHRPCS